MRKLMIALAAIATLGGATAANAQYRDRDRVREDRREYREERREYRDALRYGDRGDIREERREFRDAGRDLRRSEYATGRYGRDGYPGRGYRDNHRRYDHGYYDRGRYDRGYYGYDRGRGYDYGYGYGDHFWRDWRVGYRVPRGYFGPRYYVDDYRAYRLYGPPRGHRWHRYGRDAFLLGYDGRVSDVRLGIFLGL